MRNSKLKSAVKKVKTISLHGVDAIVVGKYNFENPNSKVEALAKERKNICVNCPFFVEEPIEFLQVIDKIIPELSNKMCDKCGCTLSYKLRQSKIICDKW